MNAAVGTTLATVVGLAQDAASAGDDASSQLTAVIYGLVALAVVITIATVLFWRATRPGGRDRGA